MLGFGRALGETIAVALVLSRNFEIVWHDLHAGRQHHRRQHRAMQFGDAGKIGLGALIASGLVLFVITLVVNIGRPLHHRAAASIPAERTDDRLRR